MEKQFMKGNEAIAEAAVQAGCRYFFGYPITPQNEIPEYLSWRLPELGGTFVQAESEVAAINMVYGAAGAGARVMTSSSGPGISLKSEGISYIAGSNLPCVIVNIMRAGPGLGGIQASQSDYFQATRGGGHGDYHCIVYTPSTIQQAVDLTQLAFDKADQYRMPVMILGDGTIGQMMEPVIIKEKPPVKTDKSWAATGWSDKSRPRAVINSLSLDPVTLEKWNDHLQAKYKEVIANEVMFETYNTDDCDILVVAYGTTARTIRSVIDENELPGHKIGLFSPLTVWPYPEKQLKEAAKGKKAVLVVEMNAGQMLEDVRLSVGETAPIHFYGRTGGMIPTSEEIFAQIVKLGEVL
ncbi:3-methyl-2-oxobutanoate dehydrogenase subunit VorB [Tyzzerella sp. OttesenSCG-928-J15]|nr:3-methyl-2-oxobutanoate dehydrogenase subunit VorB [Tyzzerella sp. OttesenSCG-928-J15]